jgi:hypothetical protein
VAVAVATLGTFIAAFPARYAQSAHPTRAVRTAIAQIGLSAGAYAFYNVTLDALFVSVFATIGIAIFWRPPTMLWRFLWPRRWSFGERLTTC